MDFEEWWQNYLDEHDLRSQRSNWLNALYEIAKRAWMASRQEALNPVNEEEVE